MKPILTLAALLALLACDNPITDAADAVEDHFDPPAESREIIIPGDLLDPVPTCPADTLPDGEPMPPRPSSTPCKEHRP